MHSVRSGAPGRALAIAAVALVIALAWVFPVRHWIVSLAERLRGMGAAGVLLFIAAYVVCTVALLPGSLLTLAAGFAYGPVRGLLIVSPASVIAATIAFLLGRTLLRSWAHQRIARVPRTRALDRALGQNSFKVILILRLSPAIPFNVLNYALGVTDASLAQYVAASFLGMLPGTWLYAYLGSLAPAATGLAEAGRGSDPQRLALSIAGLVATVVVVVLVTRAARRALEEELKGGA